MAPYNTLLQNATEVYFKMCQVFYYKMRQKFVTKCVRFLITKCDSLITNCDIILMLFVHKKIIKKLLRSTLQNFLFK